MTKFEKIQEAVTYVGVSLYVILMSGLLLLGVAAISYQLGCLIGAAL